jgi:anti-anti-sigma regulatory factor
MRQVLLDALHGAGDAVIDLSEVEDCDAASAQVLCSALKTMPASGTRFRLAGMTEAVASTFALLGLPLTEESGPDEGEHRAT